MSVTFRNNIYLEVNKPERSQFRVTRRAAVKPVIVLHTAENISDTVGADSKAENVANFIKNRKDPGSYHLIGDRDSIIQLVRFASEAYHDGTGSNRWSIGISLAIQSKDWSSFSAKIEAEYVESMAEMAAISARWLESVGVGAPEVRRLTKVESDSSLASGFISHGDRDPSRRSDPGEGFPWNDFLVAYSKKVSGNNVVTGGSVEELQRALNVAADGIIGPITMAAVRKVWLGNIRSFDATVASKFTNEKPVVIWLQKILEVEADGIFGSQTESASISKLDKGGIVAYESILGLVK